MRQPLTRLLRPRSIAVIGGGWGENVITQCQKMNFAGDILPVHPRRKHIRGLPCFPCIEALPTAPDAAFVAVNRFATVEAVAQLRKKGAGGAVCFASGFLEAEQEDADGAELQEKLLQAAGDMPFLGPNCYGFVNYLDNALLWPDQQGGCTCERGVAIITQSSNMAMNLTMQRRGLPIAYMVAAGNQAQTGFADIGAALLEDERVTLLGLHIEGISNLKAFEALASKARQLNKPIVAIKSGKSEQARTAAISHTASLAGNDAGAAALFERLGVARVPSLTSFMEALKLLHIHGPLSGKNLFSMSCSGGEAGLMADAAAMHPLHYPPLTAHQQADLRDCLGQLVALHNPLDYHTFIWNDEPAMTQTFTAMMKGDKDLAFLVLDYPRQERCDDSSWRLVENALQTATTATGSKAAVVATLPENLPEETALKLTERGIAPMMGIEDAMIAAAAAAFAGEAFAKPPPLPLLLPLPAASGKVHTLGEDAAKALLQKAGIAVPPAGVADSAQAAATLAEDIGYPVVLKALGVAHKTEVGAVRLNLTCSEAVLTAANAMQHTATAYLVERQIEDAVAELLIGVVRDPAHGFLLTLAAGGIFTEIARDKTHLLLPVLDDDIAAHLQKLKIAPLLQGYRNRPGCHIPAVLDVVQRLASLVAAHADSIEEIEINPLLCTPTAAIAADALIHMKGESHA